MKYATFCYDTVGKRILQEATGCHSSEQRQNQQSNDKKEMQIEGRDYYVCTTLYLLGNKLMADGKFKDAIDCYDKAIELDWTNAVYLCNR